MLETKIPFGGMNDTLQAELLPLNEYNGEAQIVRNCYVRKDGTLKIVNPQWIKEFDQNWFQGTWFMDYWETADEKYVFFANKEDSYGMCAVYVIRMSQLKDDANYTPELIPLIGGGFLYFNKLPGRITTIKDFGKTFFVNAVPLSSGGLYSFDGNTAKDVVPNVAGWVGCSFKNRLVLVDTDDLNSIFWSNAGQYQIFDRINNFLQVAKFDGDEISGITEYMNSVIVFKQTKIYRCEFNFQAEIFTDVIPVSSKYGCPSGEFRIWNGYLWFINQDGHLCYTGGGKEDVQVIADGKMNNTISRLQMPDYSAVGRNHTFQSPFSDWTLDNIVVKDGIAQLKTDRTTMTIDNVSPTYTSTSNRTLWGCYDLFIDYTDYSTSYIYKLGFRFVFPTATTHTIDIKIIDKSVYNSALSFENQTALQTIQRTFIITSSEIGELRTEFFELETPISCSDTTDYVILGHCNKNIKVSQKAGTYSNNNLMYYDTAWHNESNYACYCPSVIDEVAFNVSETMNTTETISDGVWGLTFDLLGFSTNRNIASIKVQLTTTDTDVKVKMRIFNNKIARWAPEVPGYLPEYDNMIGYFNTPKWDELTDFKEVEVLIPSPITAEWVTFDIPNYFMAKNTSPTIEEPQAYLVACYFQSEANKEVTIQARAGYLTSTIKNNLIVKYNADSGLMEESANITQLAYVPVTMANNGSMEMNDWYQADATSVGLWRTLDSNICENGQEYTFTIKFKANDGAETSTYKINSNRINLQGIPKKYNKVKLKLSMRRKDQTIGDSPTYYNSNIKWFVSYNVSPVFLMATNESLFVGAYSIEGKYILLRFNKDNGWSIIDVTGIGHTTYNFIGAGVSFDDYLFMAVLNGSATADGRLQALGDDVEFDGNEYHFNCNPIIPDFDYLTKKISFGNVSALIRRLFIVNSGYGSNNRFKLTVKTDRDEQILNVGTATNQKIIGLAPIWGRYVEFRIKPITNQRDDFLGLLPITMEYLPERVGYSDETAGISEYSGG